MELFRKSAGYRFLDAFVLANVVELGTGHFCERFLNLQNDPGGRTYSQMTHAARSGCRNFAEGSERLMTSYSTAIELLDVARAWPERQQHFQLGHVHVLSISGRQSEPRSQKSR